MYISIKLLKGLQIYEFLMSYGNIFYFFCTFRALNCSELINSHHFMLVFRKIHLPL